MKLEIENRLDFYDSMEMLFKDLRYAFDMLEDIFCDKVKIHDEEDEETFGKMVLLQRICRERLDELISIFKRYGREFIGI